MYPIGYLCDTSAYSVQTEEEVKRQVGHSNRVYVVFEESQVLFCYPAIVFNLSRVLTDVPVMAVMLRKEMPFFSSEISLGYCCL